MKITVENLGLLRYAEFELGDLTIISGKNNTGKTYATYALFGFLHTWERSFRSIASPYLDNNYIEQILNEGSVSIDLSEFINHKNTILELLSEHYSEQFDKIFASKQGLFKDTYFKVDLSDDEVYTKIKNTAISKQTGSVSHEYFSFIKNAGEMTCEITLLVDRDNVKISHRSIKQFIISIIGEILFKGSFPKPFITSTERTGAAVFISELNLSVPNVLDNIGKELKFDLVNAIFGEDSDYEPYPLPVKKNVEFIKNLENVSKRNSFLAEEHPDLLDDFADIIGGSYEVAENQGVRFVPNKHKVRLSMGVSSSAVRSMLDIGFYLHHLANREDILMIDEPELNLHPENQRRLARLLARLVYTGIKVFITTHSDYIIKEFNTLIMLNQDAKHLQPIIEKEGYKESELLRIDQIKMYIAEATSAEPLAKELITPYNTLTPAEITQTRGIEARSFDVTINDMNRIEDDIIWGGE